jgi:hypothetical protein
MNIRVITALVLLTVFLIGCFFIGTAPFKAFALPEKQQQQQPPQLHRIDQKWINYIDRFIYEMQARGGINDSNSYEYHLFKADSLMMRCVNSVVDNNKTTYSMLPVCDNAVSMEYGDPHGYGRPIDFILPPDMALGIGATSWSDLAMMYL